MNPSQGQFANVVNFEQKKEQKNQDRMASRSPFGPVQSKLVKPVTSSPEDGKELSSPDKESQPLAKDSDV